MKTFGDIEIENDRFPDGNTTEFEEQLPKDFSPDLIQYVNEKAMEMERNYMSNGLSEEEVELRKRKKLLVLFFSLKKLLRHFQSYYG